MKDFARATKLPSIGGRAAYITDPGRQEEIVVRSRSIDWKPYIDFEARQHKTNVRQNEGRELMISLPNEWYTLPKPALSVRINTMARSVFGKERDYQWAVHWNKARTNMHVHIIYSERLKVAEPGRWDRDVYLKDDGNVARRKSDRARDSEGNVLPPVHKKGDLKDPFTAKDPKFKSKAWLHEQKQELKQLMQEWGVDFDKPEPLHQFHEGKGSESKTIRLKNEIIKIVNSRLADLETSGYDIYQKLLPSIQNQFNQNRLTVPYFQDGKLRCMSCSAPERAYDFIKQDQTWVVSLADLTKAIVLKSPTIENPAPEAQFPSQAQNEPNWGQNEPKKDTETERVLELAERTKAEVLKPIKPDFSLLIEARKEYNLQAAAIEIDRRLQAVPVLSAPNRMKEALAKFEASREQITAARMQLRSIHSPRFPIGKAAREAKEKIHTALDELHKAEAYCDKCFEALTAFGVPQYHDGIKLSGHTLDSEDMEYVHHHADRVLQDLQSKAAYNARFYEQPPVPPNPEALNDAKMHFETLLDKIPEEYREEAEKAILEADRGTVKAIPAKQDRLSDRIAKAKEQAAAARAAAAQRNIDKTAKKKDGQVR